MARHDSVLTAMAAPEWRLCFVYLCLGLLNFSSVQNVECLCSADESQALLALKRANPSSALSSWIQGSDCCSGWAGVTCEDSGTHVIALNVTLSYGDISESICNLHEVQVLNISLGVLAYIAASLPNEIPACFWNLTEMRYLTIATLGLNLQGSIPAQICTLKHLVHLDVANASMTGVVPDCLWEMIEWEYIDLGLVKVSESFSSQVCNLRNLTHLGVGGNEIEYALQDVDIPACIGKLAKLEYLSLLGFDQYPIPVETCNLVNLRHLRFSILQDSIPKCLWNMTNLEHLFLEADSPSIYVPPDLCNLKKLSYFLFRSHSLAHRILPECIWNMTGLEVLDIYSPNLSGSFTSQMCNLPKLRVLVLDYSYMDLTESPPACIWNMTHLEELALSGLDLSNMEYPEELTALSLNTLALGSTRVSKDFLDRIGNLTALQVLSIEGNSISSLSNGMQSLLQLTALEAGDNLITTIPAWMGRLQNLETLDLTDNAVKTLDAAPSSGQFPQSDGTFSGLSNLTRLQNLYLSDNRIAGVPLSFFNLTQLAILYLSDNLLQDFDLPVSCLPNLGVLLLSNNPLRHLKRPGPAAAIV